MTGALILGGLIALLLTGVPVFAALGLTAAVVLFLFEGHTTAMADTVFAHLSKPVLVIIPLFLLMAQIMVRAKVVDDLFQMTHALIGHIRGGLGVATVGACTIFSSISGSSVATTLSVGASAIPQMEKYRYPRSAAFGVVAAGGTLGILIPPSGPMILYSVVSDASIGALFLAGIVPGIMLAAIFSIWCIVAATIRRDGSPPFAGFCAIAAALRRSIWALLAPPVVMGGIYLGIFTATEAAAVGATYALFVAFFIYGNFGWRDLWICTRDAMRTSMMVFMIIAAAAMFGHAITIIRLPMALAEVVTQMGLGRIAFLLIVMAMIFVMGMFFESIAIILITTPILLPALIALDIDLIWYGILLMINLELAMITPPVGMNLFAIKGITDAPLKDVIRGASPYVLLMLMGLLLLLAFPGLATWLPYSAGFGR